MRKIILLLILFASFAFANEQKDLEKYVAHWQTQFHMSEWVITVTPVPEIFLFTELEYPAFGMSNWNVENKTGRIYVLERSDYSPEAMKAGEITNIKLDQKNTVLHEFIHCVIEHGENEWAVQILTEQIIPEHQRNINKGKEKDKQ